MGIAPVRYPCLCSTSKDADNRSRGASLFLTGGTGFLGRAFLRRLSDAFAKGVSVPDVTVLTRDPAVFHKQHPEFRNQPWLGFHAGDILDPASLPRVGKFTHVLHAAADSTLGPQLKPLMRHDQIVTGTRNLLDFTVAMGVRRFLLVSSGGAYGPQPTELDKMPEDYNGMPDPLVPANAYGVAKRFAEHLCALYSDAHGIEIIIARCFAFVGQDIPLNAHLAIGNFIRDALYGQEMIINGNGSPVRSYLDQRDFAVWLYTMLFHAPSGGVYNVGSDIPISILDLATRVRDLLAPDKHITIRHAGCDSQMRSRYVPDISRARNELRLDVWTTLDDAIRHAARYIDVSDKCGP